MIYNKIRFSLFYAKCSVVASFTKLTNWEYWPMYLVYVLVYFQYAYYIFLTKSWFYFSATNPGIENGGMLGESKYTILQKIPAIYRPAHLLILPKENVEMVLVKLKIQSLQWPLFCKPDIGERGAGAIKISTKAELELFLSKMKVPYIIQEYVDKSLELGVFYVRFPNEKLGKITSIVGKKFLDVTGNGKHSLQELILLQPRSFFQRKRLKSAFANSWSSIPIEGEIVNLGQVGNHCLGTTFLDFSHYISPELNRVFDTIANQIEGFYYGRFDLRGASWEQLSQGQSIQILELNGVGAEPAHIYQPGYSFIQAQSSLIYHWRCMYEIAKQNHSKGIPYLTWLEAKKYLKLHKQRLGDI